MRKLIIILFFLVGCSSSSYDSQNSDYSYGGEESELYEDSYDINDSYTEYESFGGYECTEDCSGHEAGYQWAEDNGIETEDDCGGNSDSFVEGCWSYVEDNY